jgi:RNA polymerase sigma factor (sigma-70 family)
MRPKRFRTPFCLRPVPKETSTRSARSSIGISSPCIDSSRPLSLPTRRMWTIWLQNTFMVAYKSARRFSDRSTVRSWLFGIAINSVRRHRRQSARHTRNLSALAHTPIKEVPTPHDAAESKQQLDRLNHAISQLPSKYREPFVLCEIEGFKGVDAAKVLGLREGTLWRRLHVARKTLACAVKRQP